MLGQKKTHSLIEAATSTAIGLGIGLIGQLVIFYFENIQVTFGTNIRILLFMTILSMIRSFYVRRIFNWFHVRSAHNVNTTSQESTPAPKD